MGCAHDWHDAHDERLKHPLCRQGGKGDSKLGRFAATGQEQTHETPVKQKGCWGKLRKVTMGK